MTRILHPLAIPNNKSGFAEMKAGEIVKFRLSGKKVRVDEFTHDGDAFVVYEDGSFGIVKASSLAPLE